MTKHETHPEHLPCGEVIFEGFPTEAGLYQHDIRPFVESTIERFGIKEWRATVLTGELHGHLGIYAILGVKMGLRALELLGCEGEPVEVISYAGSHPPVSCMNDGLQVATGATLGHGNFRTLTSSHTLPKAQFICGEKHLTLTLNEHYLKRLEVDIKEGIADFGRGTPSYWEHIRRCALRYWAEWDRQEIFTVSLTANE